MKRWLLGWTAAIALVAGAAYALQTTPTPRISPETGEASVNQAEIVNVARLKVGSGTVTAGGTAAAATATLNNAAGVVTWPANLVVVSSAVATLTLTNSKVNAGDMVFAMTDSTGAAAGAVPEVSSVQVSNGQIIFVVTNASAVSPAVAVKVQYLVITAGNPN